MEDYALRILWVNNIAIPRIAEDIGMQSVPVGGWMVKLADEIGDQPDVELTIAFPFSKEVQGNVGGISYFSFVIDDSKIKVSSLTNQARRIEEIIRKTKPDCIHIFGTEKAHSYVFTEVAKSLGLEARVCISIQGLTSVYARHYEGYLPHSIVSGFTLRDLYKGNVAAGKRRFERSGKFEIAALKNVRHIIGRTDWDKACTGFINPEAWYHFNNEMLRDSFYTAEPWSFECCVPHNIFMSQATLPLKGVHLVIEAVSMLKPLYPDIKLCIAGKSYTQKKRCSLSKYEKYVLDMIQSNGLGDSIKFTGFLDEQRIVKEYKKANVFVCASSIENSPNSVCEAMMLGVPVITSLTGGIENLLTHGKEGYIYQADAPYMLAFYLKELFDNKALAETLGRAARETAKKRHNIETIVWDLMRIYETIGSSEE